MLVPALLHGDTTISLPGLIVIAAIIGVGLMVRSRRREPGYYAQFTKESPIGMGAGEEALHEWWGERYFGPLLPGSSPTAGDWARRVLRGLVRGGKGSPEPRLRGAPVQLRVTNRGRLVVTIANGWQRSLRPKVLTQGAGARDGMKHLFDSGPKHRAGIHAGFDDGEIGRFNRPDRGDRGETRLTLIEIEPPGSPQTLLLWVPDEAVRRLQEWARGG